MPDGALKTRMIMTGSITDNRDLDQEVTNINVPREIDQKQNSNNAEIAQGEKNAFRIKPRPGAHAGLKAIKQTIESSTYGCHFNYATKSWSCPIGSKEAVESLLKEKNIKAVLETSQDNFFNKSENEQKADKLLSRRDIVLKKWLDESAQFVDDKDRLENDILSKSLSDNDPSVIAQRAKMDERKKELDELKGEADQLQNSASLYETQPLSIEDKVVEELNKKHAVVHTSEFSILTEKPHAFIRGAIDFTLESKQSLLNTYENQITNCSDGHQKSKAQIWLKHPKRREFLDGIVFDPSDNGHKKNAYNIWKGFAVEPKKGCCNLFKDHIKTIICAGNLHYYRYVWKWLASLIQHPDVIATGLVIMGSQGTGKGKFVKTIGKLFGPHFVHLDNLERLLGNFNFHLKNAVLVFGDEAIWGGNKKDIGKLKAMVTEEYAMIEPKGKDPIAVRNFRHFILASNEDWPLHLERDDRRFLVLEISDKRKEDFAYFKAIDAELDNGGLEALLYELQNEDISDFNPRELPQNKEAFQVKMSSAPSVELYIYESLNNGCFDIGNPSPDNCWKDTIPTHSIFDDYASWCDRQRIASEKQERLGKALLKLIPSILKSRPRVLGGRQPIYQLPALSRAREEFQKAYKTGSEIWE